MVSDCLTGLCIKAGKKIRSCLLVMIRTARRIKQGTVICILIRSVATDDFYPIFKTISPKNGWPVQVNTSPWARSLSVRTSLLDNQTFPDLQRATQLPHLPVSQLKGIFNFNFFAACRMLSG